MKTFGPTTMSLAILSVLSAPAPVYAEIGTVAAVNQQMDGTPPQSAKRQLLIGDGLVSNERVETSEDGSGQLLFIDQTSLTVAPNSDIILDKYIFDPEKQAGDIALSIARGGARFIGGLITKRSTAIVRTPASTIGIRGGMVHVEVDNGITKVTNIASITVTVETYGDSDGDGLDDGPNILNAAGEDTGERRQPTSSVSLSRSNATATSDPSGTSYSGIATDEELLAAYQSIEGSGTGGTAEPLPSETVNSQVSSVSTENSETVGGSTNEPVTTTGAVTPSGSSAESAATPDPGSDTIDDVDQRAEASSETATEEALSQSTANEDLIAGLPEPDLPAAESAPPAFDPIPDPADIISLSGTATYLGTAAGTLVDLNGIQPDQAISGTSTLRYDFTQRNGVLQLNIDPGTFTVDLAADAANAAQFSGTNTIFGGPDSIQAQGGFRATPTDPAAGVAGNFNLDLQTQRQQVTGDFEGTR